MGTRNPQATVLLVQAVRGYGELKGRINQYVVVNLHREFRYGVTTADEGLLPISPSKLKYLPHPSDRQY